MRQFGSIVAFSPGSDQLEAMTPDYWTAELALLVAENFVTLMEKRLEPTQNTKKLQCFRNEKEKEKENKIKCIDKTKERTV